MTERLSSGRGRRGRRRCHTSHRHQQRHHESRSRFMPMSPAPFAGRSSSWAPSPRRGALHDCNAARARKLAPRCRTSGGRARHAGADAVAEIALHPLGDGVRAAVGLEAVEVDPEALAALPQVRVVQAPWSAYTESTNSQNRPCSAAASAAWASGRARGRREASGKWRNTRRTSSADARVRRRAGRAARGRRTRSPAGPSPRTWSSSPRRRRRLRAEVARRLARGRQRSGSRPGSRAAWAPGGPTSP